MFVCICHSKKLQVILIPIINFKSVLYQTGVIIGVIVYYVSQDNGEASYVASEKGVCGDTINAPRDLYLNLIYDEEKENVTFLYIRDSVVGQVQATSMDFGSKVSILIEIHVYTL